jgi:hypothetical protein
MICQRKLVLNKTTVIANELSVIARRYDEAMTGWIKVVKQKTDGVAGK